MPSYELALILKKLGTAETASVLKRTANNIWKSKGILFGIENLGSRPLPYKISSFGKRYTEGSYFVMRLDLPTSEVLSLTDECKRDIDVLSSGLIKDAKHVEKTEPVPCTLDEEMKPPAYREDIQEMIKSGRRRERQFKLNIGLDYNPFNR